MVTLMSRSVKSTLHGLRRRWASYSAPAPMTEFDDYDSYWNQRGELHEDLARWRLAAEIIPDGATVLDVGCGTGEFLAYLKSKRPNVRAAGLDFSERAVEITRAKGFEATKLDLQLEEVVGEYDYITCFETLEHIPEAELTARRLALSVRRQLIVSVPNVGYIDNRIRLGLFGRFPNTNCIMHVKEHVRFWTLADFKQFASACGLKIVRVEGQYGGRWLPWERFPSLLSPGLFYVLEPQLPASPDH
jgi:methionine biosynthesis protein MetW